MLLGFDLLHRLGIEDAGRRLVGRGAVIEAVVGGTVTEHRLEGAPDLALGQGLVRDVVPGVSRAVALGGQRVQRLEVRLVAPRMDGLGRLGGRGGFLLVAGIERAREPFQVRFEGGLHLEQLVSLDFGQGRDDLAGTAVGLAGRAFVVFRNLDPIDVRRCRAVVVIVVHVRHRDAQAVGAADEDVGGVGVRAIAGVLTRMRVEPERDVVQRAARVARRERRRTELTEVQLVGVEAHLMKRARIVGRLLVEAERCELLREPRVLRDPDVRGIIVRRERRQLLRRVRPRRSIQRRVEVRRRRRFLLRILLLIGRPSVRPKDDDVRALLATDLHTAIAKLGVGDQVLGAAVLAGEFHQRIRTPEGVDRS